MNEDLSRISIRELTDAAELKVIRDLAWKIFPATYEELIPPEQIPYMMRLMYDDAVLRKEFEEGMKFAVITECELPIGYISWHLTDPRGGKVMRLEKLYLDHACHGRSIGNMGIRYVTDEAGGCGLPDLERSQEESPGAESLSARGVLPLAQRKGRCRQRIFQGRSHHALRPHSAPRMKKLPGCKIFCTRQYLDWGWSQPIFSQSASNIRRRPSSPGDAAGL